MQVEGNIFEALRQAEAAGVMPLGQAAVSEEVRGAMNSIHEAMAGLPPESPLRAQLDDMLSGLQSGTIAPNNVATAIANVMQAVQGAGSGSVGASSAAAFKASMINDVTHPLIVEHAGYVMESLDHHFEGMDQQYVDEIEKATKRALVAQTEEERQAAEDDVVQAYLDGGGTEPEEFRKDWRAKVEAASERVAEQHMQANIAQGYEERQDALTAIQGAIEAAGSRQEGAHVAIEGAELYTASVTKALKETGVSAALVRVDVVDESLTRISQTLEKDTSETRSENGIDEAEEINIETAYEVVEASLKEPKVPSSSPDIAFDPGLMLS